MLHPLFLGEIATRFLPENRDLFSDLWAFGLAQLDGNRHRRFDTNCQPLRFCHSIYLPAILAKER